MTHRPTVPDLFSGHLRSDHRKPPPPQLVQRQHAPRGGQPPSAIYFSLGRRLNNHIKHTSIINHSSSIDNSNKTHLNANGKSAEPVSVVTAI